jgi:hypothetical protein
MTNKLMVAVIGVCLSAAPTSAYAALYAYYNLNNLTNDAALPGPDATATGGATTGQAGGKVGSAAVLDPTSALQFINVPISFGASGAIGQEFTISAWYNLDSPPATGTNTTGRYFVFESQTGFDISYGTRDDATQGTPGVFDGQFFTENPSGNFFVADAAAPGWHHVALTYVPTGTGTTTITGYVDGMARGTLSATTASVSDMGINFGSARSAVINRGFDGLLDEIAVWNHALTPAGIASVYQTGLNGQGIPAPRGGDANGDGVVNAADFFLISDNLSDAVTLGTMGDVDIDGEVTFRDFRIWRNAAPAAVLAELGFAVPEPGTCVQLLVAMMTAVSSRRSRKNI